jgi:soluble lytic murein transglycosylase-like protein
VPRPRYCGVATLIALLALAAGADAQIYTRVNEDGVVEATNVPDARGFRLTYPGKGTLIHSRGFRGVYRGEYDHHIAAAASAHGVSADLIRAVIQVESAFDYRAISSKGARGLMQLMPATARRLGVTDSFDPRQNIFGGTKYLRWLLDLFEGSVPLALAGYNAGENAVTRYKGIPPYKETLNYVRKVQSLLSSHTGLLAFSPASRSGRGSTARASKQRVVPARPSTYYKWKDRQGMLHVAQSPPGDGVPYTLIRALP